MVQVPQKEYYSWLNSLGIDPVFFNSWRMQGYNELECAPFEQTNIERDIGRYFRDVLGYANKDSEQTLGTRPDLGRIINLTEQQMLARVIFCQNLDDRDRAYLQMRDETYDGSWEAYLKKMYDTTEEALLVKHPVELNGNQDLRRIQRMIRFEREHDQNLSRLLERIKEASERVKGL